MANIETTTKENAAQAGNSLRVKALAMALIGIVILIVSIVMSARNGSVDYLLLGGIIAAFLLYKGVTVVKDLSSNKFKKIVLVCKDVNKTGYRKQNQTVTFKKENTDSYLDITLLQKAGKFQIDRKYVFYLKDYTNLDEISELDPTCILGWEKSTV